MSRLTTRCSFLEEENANVKRQLTEANRELVSASEIRTTEVKAIKTSTNATIAELRSALSVSSNELQGSQEYVKSKEQSNQRHTMMLQSEISRLENKIRAEVYRFVYSMKSFG